MRGDLISQSAKEQTGRAKRTVSANHRGTKLQRGTGADGAFLALRELSVVDTGSMHAPEVLDKDSLHSALLAFHGVARRTGGQGKAYCSGGVEGEGGMLLGNDRVADLGVVGRRSNTTVRRGATDDYILASSEQDPALRNAVAIVKGD